MKTLERFRSFDSLFCLACSTCSLLLLGGATLPGATVWFTQDTVISAMDTNYDGAEISISNCTVTVSGAHRFARLHLLTGATLTHPHNGTEVPAGLNLSIDGDLLIEPGARVDVSGRGYPAGTGPGAGKPALYGSVGEAGVAMAVTAEQGVRMPTRSMSAESMAPWRLPRCLAAGAGAVT